MRRVLSVLLGALLLSTTVTALAAGDRALNSTNPPLVAWQAPAFYSSPHAAGRTALTDLAPPMPYIPLVPCRQYDSRSTSALADNTPRTVTLSGAPCGIPATARAVAVNITVFNILSNPGNAVFKVGTWSPPTAAWINYGVTESQRANAGVLSLNGSAAIVVQVNQGAGSVDFVVDVFGYYGPTPATASNYFTLNTNSGGYTMFLTNSSTSCTGPCGIYQSVAGGDAIWGVTTGTTGILFGVKGQTASTTLGSAGVFGQDSSGAPTNWNATTDAGVIGVSQTRTGVLGVSMFGGGSGVRAIRINELSPFAVIADARLAPSSGVAADFIGDVGITASLFVSGSLSKGSGTFKIDHPLDPENKYLYHSFVESPDMMNIYNGIVELDALGEAIVHLPAYFEALNSDYRYQLTAIGRSQATLYIADEVQDLRFRIAGGKPHARVSWQVTGIRKDPFANAHRVVAEVEKEPEARGYYVHPAEYKQPADKNLTHKLTEAKEAKEVEQALKAKPTR